MSQGGIFCPGGKHQYYRTLLRHVHEGCVRKFCWHCVMEGGITHCHSCRTELEPTRCFSCKWAVKGSEFVQLDCKEHHKLCSGCLNQCKIRFFECQSREHKYCEACHKAELTTYTECCNDVCQKCHTNIEGAIHLNEFNQRECGDCTTTVARGPVRNQLHWPPSPVAPAEGNQP
jgi:hypothetical protein